MPFIGKSPSEGKNNILLDAITTSATATYNLLKDSVAYSPVSAQSLIVSLNGVTQAPINAYTVSGSTIVFASALTSNDVIDYIIATTGPKVQPTVDDASVTSSKLASDSVTSAKIADDAVVQAAIADEAVDEARLQISNAGSNGQFLSKQSGNTGGLTWAAAGIDGWSSNSNNLLPDNASSGIYLGVNSATAANLLDDYEEGTWTPEWSSSGGEFGSVSYSNQHGDYVKIGNWCHVQCYINSSGCTIGSASGVLRVKGLPFTSINGTNNSGAVSIGYSKYFAGGQADGPGFGVVAENATYIHFYEKDGSFDGFAPSQIQTSGTQYFYFSLVYMTA
jgi:hypothetical protein